jgi:hypothetical protein
MDCRRAWIVPRSPHKHHHHASIGILPKVGRGGKHEKLNTRINTCEPFSFIEG